MTVTSIQSLIQSKALQHIAIIMDGNRRWAQNKGLPSTQGHYQGYKTLKDIVEYCSDVLHLPALTVYAFSTENWQRPGREVDFLMKLFHQTLQDEIDELDEKNVQLRFIGNIAAMSPSFYKQCLAAQQRTAQNTGMIYQVAINYGGRAEITAAVKQLAQAVKQGDLEPDALSEADITRQLYTGQTMDPDLLIRTGGESRLSNFLLWQAAYAEICIIEELWPEFTPDVLNRTIQVFQQRQRRFGR